MKYNIILTICAISSIIFWGVKINSNAASIESKKPPLITIETMDTEIFEEENENELIEKALLSNAHVIENCKITYYCTCSKCCGKSDGITKSGVLATPYITCAVDSRIIPLGSDILIDYGDGEIHYLRADDTGATIKGNKIDICVSNHNEALELGVNYATVYWVKQ